MENKEKCRWWLVLPACIVVLVMFLAGCDKGSAMIRAKAADDRISIVCTTFPQYDWTKNIIVGNEDEFELVLLSDKGGDLHNYQPSAIDIATISSCDMLVYVGGESDSWVGDVLRDDDGADFISVNMMDMLDGMLYEEEHDLETHHGDKHNDGGHDIVEYDEHVWLSLRNAERIVRVLCNEIAKLDADNVEIYEKNCEAYLERLDLLDKEYKAVVEKASADALVFADRFPFRYMAQDYDIECFAAFEGCSAETEASFETVSFLVEAVREHKITAILVLEGSDTRLAQVIAENSGRNNIRILVINSLQSVSEKDIESGISYLAVMEDNLDVLRQALE